MWLRGWQAIADYTQRSKRTLARWRKRYGLPVCNLPDGTVGTSSDLLDGWLLERAYYQEEMRKTMHSTSNISKAAHCNDLQRMEYGQATEAGV